MNKLIPLAILLSWLFLGEVVPSQAVSQKTIPPVTNQTVHADTNKNKSDAQQLDHRDILPPALKQGHIEKPIQSEPLNSKPDNNKENTNANSFSYTDWLLAISTVLLVLVTGGLVWVGGYQLRTMRTTTRAYIRISSCSPGIIFFDRTFPPPAVACKLEIKNFGETPAHITDIVIHAYISEVGQLLPYPADFTGVKRYKCSNAFLVRGQSIFYQFYDEEILNKVTIADIKGEKVILNLYGYVDYTDAFGNRRRGGFGQNYYAPYDDEKIYEDDNKFKARNNLTFLMQDGYNYDCQRKKGEGKEMPVNN